MIYSHVQGVSIKCCTPKLFRITLIATIMFTLKLHISDYKKIHHGKPIKKTLSMVDHCQTFLQFCVFSNFLSWKAHVSFHESLKSCNLPVAYKP